MIQNCEHCGLEYDAKRSTSKYCGNKCRKLAFQSVSVPVFNENANSTGSDASVVILSDGQEFVPDVTLQPEVDRLYKGSGTAYQQRLATLSLQYDILMGSEKAKEHAKRVMEGGAWC